MVNNVIHDMPNLLVLRCQPPNLPDLFHKRNKLFPTLKQSVLELHVVRWRQWNGVRQQLP